VGKAEALKEDVETAHLKGLRRKISMENRVYRTVTKGLIEPLILWSLLKKTMHGYEIVRKISELVGHRFTHGKIYPLLYRLEDQGLIRGKWERVGKRRRRKIYRITEKGLETLRGLKELFGDRLKAFIRDITRETRNLYGKTARK